MNDLRKALADRARRRVSDVLSRASRGDEFEAFDLPLGPSALSRTVDGLRSLHELARQLERDGYAVRRELERSRALGEQTVPVTVTVDRLEVLASLVLEPALRRFPWLCAAVCARIPGLGRFFAEHPLEAWGLRGRWGGLVEALAWLGAHPGSGLHPRAIPWGLHGKFFEENRAALERLAPFAGVATLEGKCLEERFGLVRREAPWRVRILDPLLAESFPGRDLSMSLPDWMRVSPSPEHLLVVENLETFLSLPVLPGTLGVWGRGHAAVGLAPWLRTAKRAWYWGDLDAQGFEILDRLRREAPAVRSLGMDNGVFDRFRSLACKGTSTSLRELETLDASEWQAYRRVVDGNLRLEQEKVPMVFVENLLRTVLAGDVR